MWTASVHWIWAESFRPWPRSWRRFALNYNNIFDLTFIFHARGFFYKFCSEPESTVLRPSVRLLVGPSVCLSWFFFKGQIFSLAWSFGTQCCLFDQADKKEIKKEREAAKETTTLKRCAKCNLASNKRCTGNFFFGQAFIYCRLADDDVQPNRITGQTILSFHGIICKKELVGEIFSSCKALLYHKFSLTTPAPSLLRPVTIAAWSACN